MLVFLCAVWTKYYVKSNIRYMARNSYFVQDVARRQYVDVNNILTATKY